MTHTSVALVTAHGAQIYTDPWLVTRSTNALSILFISFHFFSLSFSNVSSGGVLSHVAFCAFYFALLRVNASISFGCHQFTSYDSKQIYK